jgi:hypothetical protein
MSVASVLMLMSRQEEYERNVIPDSGWFSSWANCFKGGLRNQKSNLRRTILGTSLQMMQQWTGVNFIFYCESLSPSPVRSRSISALSA